MGKNKRRKKGPSLLQILEGFSARGEGTSSTPETGRDRRFVRHPRRRYTDATQEQSRSSWNPLIRGDDTSSGNCIALDCEMVGAGLRGCVSMLGRCSIVNHHGNVLYDTFVAPQDEVTDYRTAISGIRRADLVGAPSFATVQSEVKDFLKGRYLVGHDLRHDFRVLGITHPSHMIRDTSEYALNPFRKHTGNNRSRLCDLVSSVLDLEIQRGEHSSVEDAQATMYIYQQFKDVWEQSLSMAPGHSAWDSPRGGRTVGQAGPSGIEEPGAEPISRAQRRGAEEPLSRVAVSRAQRRAAGEPLNRAKRRAAGEPVSRAQRHAAGEPISRAQRRAAGEPVSRAQKHAAVSRAQRQSGTSDPEDSEDESPATSFFIGGQTVADIIKERARQSRVRRRRPQGQISWGAVMGGVMDEIADLIPGHEYDDPW